MIRHWLLRHGWVLLLCLSPVSALADEEFATYERSNEIGRQMFYERYKAEGLVMRTTILLEHCGQDGLANAVKAKETDRSFADALSKRAQQGEFYGQPNWSFLLAQSSASSLTVGYQLGFMEALRIFVDNPATRKSACDVAIKSANQILK